MLKGFQVRLKLTPEALDHASICIGLGVTTCWVASVSGVTFSHFNFIPIQLVTDAKKQVYL